MSNSKAGIRPNRILLAALSAAGAIVLLGWGAPGGASAANQASADRTETRSGDPAKLLRQAGSTSVERGISGQTTRAKKKKKVRRFYMPFAVAKRQGTAVTRSVFNNTTPDEFDERIFAPSYWEVSDTFGCERINYSKMSCLGLVAADFNLVDELDQIVGTDTFLCGWRVAVWYPRARVKRLKWKMVEADCFWASEVERAKKAIG